MHRLEGARVFDQLVGYNKKVANVKSEGCPNERELADTFDPPPKRGTFCDSAQKHRRNRCCYGQVGEPVRYDVDRLKA